MNHTDKMIKTTTQVNMMLFTAPWVKSSPESTPLPFHLVSSISVWTDWNRCLLYSCCVKWCQWVSNISQSVPLVTGTKIRTSDKLTGLSGCLVLSENFGFESTSQWNGWVWISLWFGCHLFNCEKHGLQRQCPNKEHAFLFYFLQKGFGLRRES